ncbi:hypothetical protein [Weissella tructae]|uniref:hypothetical protein n=1 Tax=Weissella tructae TaxID=887702 RepID=UPI001BDCEED6|nr:hypothetical protein [Weissella tructae]QVV90858.1 hypothetical protein KHQ32_04285 [Weissella tructae]
MNQEQFDVIFNAAIDEVSEKIISEKRVQTLVSESMAENPNQSTAEFTVGLLMSITSERSDAVMHSVLSRLFVDDQKN